MQREETIIKRTIEALEKAPPYIKRDGEYRYDKVPPWAVEDAIALLIHYQGILEAMKNHKKPR